MDPTSKKASGYINEYRIFYASFDLVKQKFKISMKSTIKLNNIILYLLKISI